MRHLVVLAPLAACDGGEGGDGTATEPIEVYACVHIAEGDLRDVGATREAAPTIEPGRDPYRVNLLPGAAGYLAFRSEGEPLVLLLDHPGAVPAVWTGETRAEVGPGEPNPNCDTDILEVIELDLEAGDHWLEVGPIYQGNVWMMLGS